MPEVNETPGKMSMTVRSFTKAIAPHVKAELIAAVNARTGGDSAAEFRHLERAHVIGQSSTYWHVVVHWRMLLWGFGNASVREVIGQIPRIVGAATKTAIGWVPEGNTGGSNVSPFRPMPIDPELARVIENARYDA